MRLFDAPTDQLVWERAALADVNPLLRRSHYLGPARRYRYAFAGWLNGECVAAQVWALPTSRKLPNGGAWLELARWCLTPEAGKNAGSRMHAYVVRWLRENAPEVTTLVSYSDPSVGHTGALYKACNWLWRPTWMRLRPPPSAGGSWDGITTQAVKDRWIFVLRPNDGWEAFVAIDDAAAIRHWEALQVATPSVAPQLAPKGSEEQRGAPHGAEAQERNSSEDVQPGGPLAGGRLAASDNPFQRRTRFNGAVTSTPAPLGQVPA